MGCYCLQETTQTEVTNWCGKIYCLCVLYDIITKKEENVKENVNKPYKKNK